MIPNLKNPRIKAYLEILFFGAAGALLMATLGAATAQWYVLIRGSWWKMLIYAASVTKPLQWTELALWALVTGALIATGLRRRNSSRIAWLLAFIIGALVPVGLVCFGGMLNQIWPGTTGPGDKPVLTLLLILYSLTAPWLLGRLAARREKTALPAHRV